MLTDAERNDFATYLADQMLQANLGMGGSVKYWVGSRHAIRIYAHPQPETYAWNVVKYCERQGWIEDPALLLCLLQKFPDHPGMKAIYDRLRGLAKPTFYIGGRAWDTCHVALALPFLDRDVTRRAIEGFDRPLVNPAQAARVLVVNGPPGSGKSFTSAFARFVVGAFAPDVAGVTELDHLAWSSEHGELTPDALARELAQPMNPSSDPPKLGNRRPERWTIDLAKWLVDVANGTSKVWYVVLDNFHLPGVPASTYMFIERVMAGLAGLENIGWNVLDTEMGPPIRLILLGYPRRLPIQTELIREETLKPVTLDELTTHFRRFFQFKGWPADASLIDKLVNRYAAILPALFPVGQSLAGPQGGSKPASWKMRELAEVVLRDCARLEGRMQTLAVAAREQGAGAPATKR
jgi:hypothetical protein